MARAYGQRPSSLLRVDDPLGALLFDTAVFSLDEAIEGALDRKRGELYLRDIDRKAQRAHARDQAELAELVDVILHGRPPERPQRPSRAVEYLFNEDRTQITGFRYVDEAPVA